MFIAPLNQEAKGRSAGIAATCAVGARLVAMQPTTKKMAEVIAAGRAAIYVADLGGGSTTICYCIYGWTGSANCRCTAARTDDILSAIIAESKARKTPCAEMVCGDLNCEPRDLTSGSLMVDELGWQDMGEQAERWGRMKKQSTCKANRNSTPTRRDVMLVNALAAEYVVDFCISDDPEYSTHSKLSIVFKAGLATDTALRNAPSINFAERFEELVQSRFKAQEKCKLSEIRKQLLENVHTIMDSTLDAARNKLEETRSTNDMTSFWQEWPDAIVKSLIQSLDITGSLKTKAKHHGKANRKEVKLGHIINKRSVAIPQDQCFINDKHRRANRQANRLEHLMQRLNKHDHIANASSRREYLEHIKATIRAVANSSANIDEEIDIDLHGWASECDRFDHTTFCVANGYIQKLRRICDAQEESQGKLDQHQLHADLTDKDRKHKTLKNILGEPSAQPLTCLIRPSEGPNGERAGTYTMNAKEVDKLARDLWGAIYEGNGGEQGQLTEDFIKRYDPFIFKQKEFDIHDICPDRLMQICLDTKASAAGLDQWAPAEFKLLSKKAFTYLAMMMNKIEEGASWPTQLKVAKAAFLSKDPDDTNNPLAFGVLMMMPTVYHKWAAMRLEDLEDCGWNATWQHPAMVAGVKKRGADDGWWHTALISEQDFVNGAPYTGGAADIYKCFDQIQRPLLYCLLKEAGIPSRIVNAYRSFQEDLTLRNSLAGGLGEGYQRRCGIPQGCPFSMLYCALIMRPWILQMEALQTIRRVLADDLLIYAGGHCHASRFQLALDETHLYLQLMGAKVAPAKSYIFTSSTTTAGWLSSHKWQHLPIIMQTIKVLTNIRDLGANISTGAKAFSDTLAQRMRECLILAHKIGRLPMDYDQRAIQIRTRLLPKALYGCETGQVPETLSNALNSAVADAITKKAKHRSQSLLFSTGPSGTDLEINANILYKRIMTLRRIIGKNRGTVNISKELVRDYRAHDYPGVLKNGTNWDKLQPAPANNRHLWTTPFPPRGAIGFLLLSLYQVGAVVDDDLKIHRAREVPIDIVNLPIQHLKAAVWHLAKSARCAAEEKTRKDHHCLWEIDDYATKQQLNSMSAAHQRLLKVVQSAGAWTLNALKHLGKVKTGECPYCDMKVELDAEHLHCVCPFFDQARYNSDEGLKEIPLTELPPSLKLGVAPAMMADLHATFWGNLNLK